MPPTEQSRRLRSARFHHSLFLLLILLAMISTVVGAVNGLHRSQDLQWSGAHLLAGHVDPWAEYLRGDPGHRIVMSQIPNYSASLYVLLLPMGFMSLFAAKLTWVVCNIFFALLSGVIAARFYGLRGRGIVTVVCLLLTATATRNTIGNGQTGLLVLALWCLGLLTFGMSAAHAGMAGLSYLKFTFSPPVFLYLMFRWGLPAALLSLLPSLAGIGLVWLWLGGGHDPQALLRIASEPFAAAVTGFSASSGDPNLMNGIEPLLHDLPLNTACAVEFGIAFLICVLISHRAFRAHRDGSTRWQMALMATMSYALFKHHPYDAVVLLFPFCYALRMWRERQAKVVLALIGYLFYAQRLLEAVHLHPAWAHVAEFGMMGVILLMTYGLHEMEAVAEPQLQTVKPDGGLQALPALG